jgi:Xaa-Pro aminopeptidase
MFEVRKEVRHGTMGVDWQGRIDFARMRRERLAKAQAKMKENGIAAMLCFTPENKRYTTGLRGAQHTGGGNDFVLVFAEDPEPIVFEQGSIWLAEKEHVTWIKPENYRPIAYIRIPGAGPAWEEEYAKKRFAPLIFEELKKKGIQKEKLAVDFLYGSFRVALENIGVKVADARYMMMETRGVKTEDEVNCMRMAGALVEIAYAEMIDFLRPGRRENEVAAVGYAALWRNGVDGVGGVTVRSGPNTAPNYLGRMPTDRIIQPGDLLFWDIFGASYMGYRSCYYRTFKVGTKPTEQEKDWFKKCREYLYNAVEVLKDGVTSADVAAKWPQAKDFGLDDEALVSGNAIGHGVGLGQYEYPLITRVNSLTCPQPIKKGMTIAMETWAGQLDTVHGWRGGCRLENIYLVTEKGSENLYSMPDDHIICPPHAMYE